MAKLYSKRASALPLMKPKKEIVSFLLSYSKALTVLKIDNRCYEIVSN